MIDELYAYACPKTSPSQKNPPIGYTIAGVTFFSSWAAVFGNTVFGIVVIALYLGLSLLTFIDKDLKSRYMMFISISTLDLSIVAIYILTLIFPEHSLVFWAIIIGILYSIIYEILVFIKIKHRLYTSPSNNRKMSVANNTLIALIFVFILRLLYNNPSTRFLSIIIFTLICAAMIPIFVISVQKLIIYLYIRNKIQVNSENAEATDDVD